MKKILLVLSIFIALGAVAGFLFLSNQSGIDEKTGLPRYRGESITRIGNDPFVKQVPADYLGKYTNELADLKKTLAENPNNIDGWLRVGVLKKFFNNYKGARDAWEYAKIINPEHSTAYFNLGGLYGAYLHDNVKAEENYLKALNIDPFLAYLYAGAAEFYKVFYTEKSQQAEDILLEGLKHLPDDPLLLQALDNLKQS